VQTSAFAHYPVAVKYSYEIVREKLGNVKKKDFGSFWTFIAQNRENACSAVMLIFQKFSYRIKKNVEV